MPAVGAPQSQTYWELSGTVGTTTVDVLIEVSGAYEWDRPEPVTKMLDPCGGPPTLIYRSDGSLPRRTGVPLFIIKLDGNEAAVQSALETIYAKRGPWALVTPTESFNVVVDPTVGPFKYQNFGGYRTITFGLAEVS